MAEVGKLSASKINTYMGCSFAYFLKYVVHADVPVNIRANFGKEIHYMLKSFYDKKFKSSESFANYFKHRWLSSVAGDFLNGKKKSKLIVGEYPYYRRNRETEEREESRIRIGSHIDVSFCKKEDVVGIIFGYMVLGANILKRFYERHKEKPRPVALEKSFGVKKDELISINGHPIRGVFDRLDNIKDNWYITDYKTDKVLPEKNSPSLCKNPQFTLYSLAFREIFKEQEKAILYYHLRTGNVLETYRNEEDFDDLKKVLDKVVNGIENDEFIPFQTSHCGFCDCRIPCQKYLAEQDKQNKVGLEGIATRRFTHWDENIPNWMEDSEEEN